jgi:hypothetical protein
MNRPPKLSYVERNKKYPYTFSDAIRFGPKFAKFGLKEPAIAKDYALEFLEITKNLIEENYDIVDCLVRFVDDEFCSYGEVELIKNGNIVLEDMKKWEDYYLSGKGKARREICKDLIDNCSLHMKLKHKKGRPRLTVNSYLVENSDKKGEFQLRHSIIGRYDEKRKTFVTCSKSAWTDGYGNTNKKIKKKKKKKKAANSQINN